MNDFRRRCPSCCQRMAPLRPAGRTVTEVDHCPACRVVWFDVLEFDGLDRTAWVDLLLALAQAPPAETAVVPDTRWRCPFCDETLAVRQGQTQHGRHGHQACPAGHGHAQRSGALLASRGLFRPWRLAERVVAPGSDRGAHDCLQCGAPLDGAGDDCVHCGSPVLVVDLPRLAQALGADGTPPPVGAPPGPAPARRHWSCAGCGRPLDPTLHAHCTACGRPVAPPLLADLVPWLRGVQERLAADAARAVDRALARLHPVDRRRVAATTQRREHLWAVERLGEEFWRRWRFVGAAFVAALLLAWCHAR